MPIARVPSKLSLSGFSLALSVSVFSTAIYASKPACPVGDIPIDPPRDRMPVVSILANSQSASVPSGYGVGALAINTGRLPEVNSATQKIGNAIRRRDVVEFRKLMPTDLAQRHRVLVAQNALHTAFHEGAVAIVRQIIEWEPEALTQLGIADGKFLAGVAGSWKRVALQRTVDIPIRETATDKEFAELIRLLIAAGAPVDHPNETFDTTLTAVAGTPASVESLEIARDLLARGATIESKIDGSWPPLFAAASSSNIKVIELFLRERKPSKWALDGAYAISSTTFNGKLETLLLEAGADINADPKKYRVDRRSTPAEAAASVWRYRQLREPMLRVIKYKGDPNVEPGKQDSPLTNVMHEHAFMKALLELGADVNYRNDVGDTPLHLAFRLPREIFRSADDHRPLIEVLPGIDPETRRKSVALLLQYGADPKAQNKAGFTPLMMTGSEDAAAVKMIADKGGTVNPEIFGRRPNGIAAPGNGTGGMVTAALLHRNDALASALLSREPALSQADCGAVYYAAFTGSTKTLRDLLDRKAPVYAASAPEGMTPLHAAAEQGHVEAVRLLLDQKTAKINETTPLVWVPAGGYNVLHLPTQYGRKTALMFAAAGGQAAVVKELIARGADLNRKDATGRTALSYARNSNAEVVQLLAASGAR